MEKKYGLGVFEKYLTFNHGKTKRATLQKRNVN